MITINEAEEILKKEYHRDNFLYLINDILLPDYLDDKHIVNQSTKAFSKVEMLGVSKKCELTVFEAVINEGYQNKRVAITQEMFKLLRNMKINNAIVAFTNSNFRNYRISLLTSRYDYKEGKIVKVLSNPRRYSYSLGFDTKTKTAYKFLISKGKVNSLNELIDRFSVEVVNKQFYYEIAKSFTELVGGERNGIIYEGSLSINKEKDKNKYAEFSVRLIGRLVFCRFLMEKHSDSGLSLIPKELFDVGYVTKQKNYYHQVLEPLFFELLNTNQKNRNDNLLSNLSDQIPYLNGGLFNPHADDHYQFDQKERCGKFGNLNIPNEWFVHFFGILNEYNFTVDENTAYDIELSIDPEMLGRIFENLLAEINPETGENAKKSTGSFYTPRDIVDYMVDSSLSSYLVKYTGINQEVINQLISYSKYDDSFELTDDEKNRIVNALYKVSVLDPACGSGAFPIGMLQKIVYILQEVDPEAKLWFRKATENVGFLMRKEIENKFNAGSLNYIRKLSVIQNSIFGIDIQPIAVEISRLRCFLSLIIEERVYDDEKNRGINPLPNLDFKFIIANSLLPLDDSDQGSLFEDVDDIQRLKDVRDEYFNADSERRTELKLQLASIQQEMLLKNIDNYGKNASKKYYQLSSWKPFANEKTDWFDPDWMFGIDSGFDIIIGNPPYINVNDMKDVSGLYRELFSTAHGSFDIYVLFFEKAYELLKHDGICCYITSNKYIISDYGTPLRKMISKNCKIEKLVDLSKVKRVFESAAVAPIITLFSKSRCTVYDVETIVLQDDDVLDNSTTIFEKRRINDLIKGDKCIFEIHVDSSSQNIISKINLLSVPLSSIAEVRTGVMGFEYWDMEKYISEGKQTDDDIRICTNGFIDKYTFLWGKKNRLYKKDIYNPFINLKRAKLSSSTKDLFKSSKIVIRGVSKQLTACFDSEGVGLLVAVHCAQLFDNKYDNYFLTGLLNSSLLNWLHLKLFYAARIPEGSLKYPISFLESLPIFSDPNNKIVKEISKLAKEITLQKEKNNSFDYLDTQLKIDELVYKLYGLTEQEIVVVEKECKLVQSGQNE